VLSSPSSTTALVAIPNQHSNSNGASVPNLPFESPQPTSLTTIPLGDANDNTLTPPPPPPLQTLPLAHASVSSTSSSSTSQQRAIRRCPKCNDNFKPPRAHHDSVTGRCVVKFDHYCPWINNAVGALNHKLFCLFLLYTALTCVAVWLLLSVRIWQCASSENENVTAVATAASANYAEPVVQDVWDGGVFLRRLSTSSGPSNSSPHDYIRHFPAVLFPEQCQEFVLNSWVRSLCLASIVFFIFTTVMGVEQVEAIRSGQGKIARLKQSVGAAGSTELSRVTTEFNEMFGGSTPYITWHWFLPVPVRFVSSSMRQVVLGYEYDASFAVLPTMTPDACVDDGMDNGDDAFGGNASIRSTDGLLRLDAAENGQDADGATYPAAALPGRTSEFTPRESSDGTTSTASIKNRRHGNHSSPNASFLGDMEGSGISLVERTKTRLS
jgi:DHHC palmitoyltransferase